MTNAGLESELWRYSASQLAALYANGDCSPVEVVNSCLVRIDSINPAVNAMVHVARETALEAARASERRMQNRTRLSKVDGVPYTVKDNLFAAQLPATWGSRLFQHHVPQSDEIAVARMKSAGAILLGKTNTPEFALGSHTDNPLFGRTLNPWNLEVTTGGSSGGAAVATATQMAPLALGTDAGGSARTPASHNGVFGMRPSTGAIPRMDGFPALAHDFQVVGLIARTAPDLALFFDCVRGSDPRDQTSVFWNSVRQARFRQGNRISWSDNCSDSPVDPQVREAVFSVAEKLKSLGCEVRCESIPVDPAAVSELWTTLSSVGVARVAAYEPDWESRVTSETAAAVRRGLDISGTNYLRAVDQVRAFRAMAQAGWDNRDLFLTPTSAALPWPWKDGFPGRIDGQPCGPRAASVFTTWVNAAGLPALSIPAGMSREGLPIGVQLVGPYGSDEAILELALQYSAAFPHGSDLGTMSIH